MPPVLPIPVVVLPGSGCTPTRECNFYDWFGRTIDAIKAADGTPKYRSIMRNMPDPHVCREKVWIPFVREELIEKGAAESTVVVGHSSGAVAAMRLAERCRLRGIVVVAGYDSDLGDANERASGYFDRPFDWDAIRANCGFVCAVGGARDTLVDIAIQRRVAVECLGLEPGVPGREWVELPDEDHFFSPPARALVDALERNVDAAGVFSDVAE